MAREADLLLPTHAGPEIGVASTKAFTCQLAVLAALAANLARAKQQLSSDEERDDTGQDIERVRTEGFAEHGGDNVTAGKWMRGHCR